MIKAEEVKEFLEVSGAKDVQIVQINGNLDTFTCMVIATCPSTRLARQHGEIIVKAVSRLIPISGYLFRSILNTFS
jgi:ribosomal silencing factor RsfS